MIESKAKKILEETFKDALAMLELPPFPYTFIYERMGQRFLTMDNAEEVDNVSHIVYINEDWANARIKDYSYDLYYLMAHEARHVYQHMQILLYFKGRTTREPLSLVLSWRDNFQNYIRNEGWGTIKPYHCQPVEVDADAFANLYVLVKRIGPASIPEDSDSLIVQRLKEIASQYGLIIK